MRAATYYIEKLSLHPHPEGGYYKETHRSSESIKRGALPDRFTADRDFSTAIYFLLGGKNFSAFHRIKSDELWHFYDGDSLTIHIIDTEGNYSSEKLGLDIDAGEKPQVMVDAGCFFAAECNDKTSYTFCGCTVAPGFNFEDFEMPTQQELTAHYPQHHDIITPLTH